MDNFVIGTIQENIKTLSSELQVLNSNTPSKLSDLSDVSAVTPADGDTLVYNATDDIFEPKAQSGGSGGSSITELDDIPGVTILNVQNNQFLKYDSGEWINSNITDNDTDNLSDLTDTLLTTPFGNDEVLKYLNGKWVNGNIPIEKLSNVYISNLQDGETLRYVQQNTRWENVNNIDTLNELSDVTVSSNLNNQVLKYNNSLGVYKNDFLNLTDLGDTNITTLANGNILIYNNGVWSAGNITYTNGTGVSITDNKIIIGQSVGTTDDVQFAEVICDEISTNTISERTTGGGITLTGAVNMTGIPALANSNKLLYNSVTGQITYQADTGGNGGGKENLMDLTDTEIITPRDNQVLKYLNGKWKNMEVGSVAMQNPHAQFIMGRSGSGSDRHVPASGYDIVYSESLFNNGITLNDDKTRFTVANSGFYIITTSFRADGPDSWSAVRILDSDDNKIAESEGHGMLRSDGRSYSTIANLTSETLYKVNLYSVAATTIKKADVGHQLSTIIYDIGSVTSGTSPVGVPMPLIVKLPSDNALSLDLTLATITGTDVIINENIIGTVTGTEVTVHPDTGLSTTPNGYVKLANPITWTQDFTIEIYFKGLSNPNDLNSEQDTNPLFSSNDEEEDTNSIIIDRKGVTNGARFIMEIRGQASGIQTSSSIPGFDGEFGHLVLTHSSTDGRKMYSNGTLVTTTHVGGAVYDFSSDVPWPHSYLGSAPQRGTAYWDTGDETIRTFRIYNRVLTASEIKTLADDRDLHVSNDVTNYTLVSGNADGTETKWVSAAAVTDTTYTNGTGVSISTSNKISIGQSVGTTDNVTFNSLELGNDQTNAICKFTKVSVDMIESEFKFYDLVDEHLLSTISSVADGTGGKLRFYTKNATSGSEVINLTIRESGAFGLGSAEDCGTPGQYLKSNGPLSAVSWEDVGAGSGTNAIALGLSAGQTTQGDYAVALGHSAGNTNQGDNSVAIGYQAGAQGQGGNSVAIGYRANNSMNNHANTVVINGSGEPLNPEGQDRTYIKTIRSHTTSEVLYYNPDSGEVTTGVLPASSGGGGTSPGGVPAPPVISTEFTLPTNVLANYDFRTYTLSVANVIDSDGDVIFTTIGSGNISFTSAEGVYTSSDPDRYLSKSDGLLPIPSGNFSLEFYIKFGPITTNVDHVFFQYNAGADITLEGFIGQDGKLYFQTRNGPNNLRLVYFDPFDTEATLANWDSTNFNHFVITWDGSGTEKLYHDRSLVTKNLTQYSGNVSYGQNLTFATLYLGGAFPGVPRDNIDDTIKFHRLYDGALSPADVSYLFDNREVSGVFKDVTNYHLVSKNATGTETKWVSAPTFDSLPYGSFTLKDDDDRSQTFVGQSATSTKYDHIVNMNKMTIYDSTLSVIDPDNLTVDNPVQYFSVQTTATYILNWSGVLWYPSGDATWAYMSLETSDDNVVQKSIGNIIEIDGSVETCTTFQIMAVLEADQKYTIKLEPRSTVKTVQYPFTQNISPWQFNLQIYSIGSAVSWIDPPTGANDVVDKTTDQTIGGSKNFSNFMGIAIGTTPSEWPLRIGSNGDAFQPGPLYFYANGSDTGGMAGNYGGAEWTPIPDPILGLYVDEGIRAARLYIMSDRRIKKDIIDIQDDDALNKLRVLQPKKYKYIDPVRGTQEVYGFIAQEVAEVIPYSVRLENSYLPSHMIFCKIVNTTVNTTIIDTNVSHTLIVNDFICFRDNKYNLIEDVKVIEIIDDKTIKVDRIFNKEDTVYTATTGETDNDLIYLYGKKIDDFHTLNKDTIWTVATAALQEVDRQLQAEKSKTLDLISRLEALEARLEILESK